MTGTPVPVEEWAPLFLTYGGDTSKPKFTKEQILASNFAITHGHCKLCDRHVEGSETEHLRMHRKELTAYLGRRRSAAERKKLAGLREARKRKVVKDDAED